MPKTKLSKAHRIKDRAYLKTLEDLTTFSTEDMIEIIIDADLTVADYDFTADLMVGLAESLRTDIDEETTEELLTRIRTALSPVPKLVFNPINGVRFGDDVSYTAFHFRRQHPRNAWLYNPFTGDLRSSEEIYTDPLGEELTR